MINHSNPIPHLRTRGVVGVRRLRGLGEEAQVVGRAADHDLLYDLGSHAVGRWIGLYHSFIVQPTPLVTLACHLDTSCEKETPR